MISWISNLIQKRSKTIFSILLFIVIIAFVFTIGAGPGLVSNDKKSYQRDFYGIDLNSAADVQTLQNATMVARYMNGVKQYDERRFQQQMMVRQVRLYLADQLAIPNPTTEELGAYIKTLPAFQDDSRQFKKDLFDSFIASISGGSSQVNQSFVTQVIKDDYRLNQLDELMAGPGMITKEEALATAAREKTSWSIEMATFDYDKFSPALSITDEAIAEFFESRKFQYQIPTEYTISFVEFDASVVKDAIEDPGDEALQQYFLTNRAKFAEAEKKLTPEVAEGEEAPTLSPLEIYAQIKNEVYAKYVQEKRTEHAVVIANDFTAALFDQKIGYQSIEFKKLLVEYGLRLKTVPPFNENTDTQLVDIVPQELYQLSMGLDKDRYFSDVVPNRNKTGYLVAFLESKTEPRIPDLDEVHDKVVNDYREMKKTEAFSEKGVSLAAAFREKLQQGETFADLAAADKLTYEKPEPFTLYQKPESVPYQLLQSIEPLKAGEMTDMITIENTGYFVLVDDKTTPEIASDDPDFANTLRGLGGYAGMSRYQTLINEMISRKININK